MGNNSMGNTLENSTAQQQPTSNGVVMYGQDWCPDCMTAEAALSKLNIEFHYVDAGVGDPRVVEIQGETRRAQRKSPNSIPCITFPDGSHLTTPNPGQLKKKCEELGLLKASASAWVVGDTY